MDQPRLRAEEMMDFDKLTTTISYLLNAAWEEGWGTFTSDFPSGNDATQTSAPIIVYSLQEMHPGLIGRNTREIKPRHRGYIPTEPDGNGPSFIEIKGQTFDGVLRFEVYAENNHRVEQLGRDFRALLDTYTGYLKQKGLKEIILNRIQNANGIKRGADDLSCRYIDYDVRFEEQWEVPTEKLREVEYKVDLLLLEQQQNP